MLRAVDKVHRGRERARAAWLKALLLHLDVVIIIGVAFVVAWRLGVFLPPWSFIVAGVVLVGGYWITYRIVVSHESRKVLLGAEKMLGLTAVAITPLSPEGTVKVRGELWRAGCCDGVVEEGRRVEIVGVQGLQLVVERVKGDGAA